MAIPNLSAFFDMIYTKSDGKLAPDGYMYNDQMFQVLNALIILVNSLTTTVVSGASVTVNGLIPPSKTTAEITALEPTATVGTLWYNSTLKKLQFKADTGIIQTITST